MATAGTSLIQKKLRFAATSSVDAGAGGSSSNLGPRQPEATAMEGSVAPNQNDHRADADTSASDEQGHDAGHTGIETWNAAQAEQPRARPATQVVVL